MNYQETSRETFQGNGNESKNNQYPNENQFIEALFSLHEMALNLANTRKLSTNEIQTINTSIESFRNYFNATKKIQASKIYLVFRLLGLTVIGINELLDYPEYFLKIKLMEADQTGNYLQHPIFFQKFRTDFNYFREEILSAVQSVKIYNEVEKYYNESTDEKIKSGFLEILQNIRDNYSQLIDFLGDFENNNPNSLYLTLIAKNVVSLINNSDTNMTESEIIKILTQKIEMNYV